MPRMSHWLVLPRWPVVFLLLFLLLSASSIGCKQSDHRHSIHTSIYACALKMWETQFQHVSSTPLPPNISMNTGILILHDFDTIIRLGPDCRGCKAISPPQTRPAQKETGGNALSGGVKDGERREMQYFEVEDDLPFIPKKLWSGGVKYTADFLPTPDGCDITVHAPGGFTSINQWRILRETIPEGAEPQLEPPSTKDLSHAETSGTGWYVQIVSDARCNFTFAGFVKGFLKNNHIQLQRAFIEKLQATPAQKRSRRPTVGRRRSSEL